MSCGGNTIEMNNFTMNADMFMDIIANYNPKFYCQRFNGSHLRNEKWVCEIGENV